MPMKRIALALTLMLALLISTLAVTLLAQVVIANPIMPIGSWSDESTPPSINIQSPSETLNYGDRSDVWLNFTVTMPLTDWYSTKPGYLYPDHYATTPGNVTQVQFFVDEKQENNVNKTYAPFGPVYFSVNLGRLSIGRHTIIISAEGSGYFGNITQEAFSDYFQIYPQKSVKTKPVHSSVQINFVVGEVTTSSTPTETPSPTPLSTQEPSQIVTVIAAFLGTIVAAVMVSAGLLVYFRKRKSLGEHS